MIASSTPLQTNLNRKHYDHLISEGFTPEHIATMEKDYGVRSITEREAKDLGLRYNFHGQTVYPHGLYFPFRDTFGQVRWDAPEMWVKAEKKLPKYITQAGKKSQAFLPKGCEFITEGAKDGIAGLLHGGIPTGFIAGVSHAAKALPKDSGYSFLFDADGWHNPKIIRALVKAAIHTGGKIQLVPEVKGEPKAGLCEWFKADATEGDYRVLLATALSPDNFLDRWIDRYKLSTDEDFLLECTKVAIECVELLS